MNRMPDDKKDHFARDGTMTSSSAIRSMQNLSQALDKDKNEKTAFVQHNFSKCTLFPCRFKQFITHCFEFSPRLYCLELCVKGS